MIWSRYRVLMVVAWMLALLVGGSVSAIAESGRSLVLSGIENDLIHKTAADVLVVAYGRIGVSVTFRWVPGKRALTEANRERTDGDIARIAGTEKKYPNLTPVSTPITYFTAVAFTTLDISDDIRSWDDLKSYRVGVRYGVRYAKEATEGMKRQFGKTIPELFRYLIRDYVDVVVVAEAPGLVSAAVDFPNAGIHRVGQPLHTVPLYHYLTLRNKDLVPKLDAVLQEMTASGELDRIRLRALDRLIVAY